MLGSRSVVALAALAASLFLIDGAVINAALAFDDNLYPNLKGQWLRARPPGGRHRPGTVRSGQVLGPRPASPADAGVSEARFEASLADQAAGGQGFWPGAQVPGGRHAGDDDACSGRWRSSSCRRSPTSASITSATTRRRIYHRRTRLADGRRSRASTAIPSANGSTPTATAASTRSRSRPATSRARAPSSRAACRCTRTTRPSSRSASISTSPIPTLLHNDLTVIDHALTRPWTVAKKYRRDNAEFPIWPEDMCARGQRLGLHRQRHVLPERGGHADAGQEGPAAARPALFQSTERSDGRRMRGRLRAGAPHSSEGGHPCFTEA